MTDITLTPEQEREATEIWLACGSVNAYTLTVARELVALKAENAALKTRLHQIWWADVQGDDCGGDGPEDRHTCSVRLCETHLKDTQELLKVETC